MTGPVLDVLAAESSALRSALAGLPPDRWSRPTRCAPWNVRELLAHVRIATARVTESLSGPAPAAATVTAAGYYRPDARFSPSANDERIAFARTEAHDGPDELAAFAATTAAVVTACAAEPAGRIVRTRHGDPMLLDDFLVTRVVEVAVHGFDLADAAGVPSWLTPSAAALVQDLLLGDGRRAPDPPRFLRAATGRASDPELLAELSPRPLALG